MSNPNICSHKNECRVCIKAKLDDRPDLCQLLRCTKFTLCAKCGQNKYLNDKQLCDVCAKILERDKGFRDRFEKKQDAPSEASDYQHDDRLTEISMTLPGNPPKELTQQEKDYYLERWKDYKGYYRDPLAYMTCHTIILEEINLNFVQGLIARTRADAQAAYSRKKNEIIETLGVLKKQLPEKEALDLSDDEKAIGRIYEAYVQEIGAVRYDSIDRLVSTEALALIPVLPHKIDLQSVLERLGFKAINITEAMNKLAEERKERDIHQVLEFVGFSINEKYALPYNQDLADEDNALAESTEESSN